MGELGSVSGRSEVKFVVIDCPNGISYIGHNVYGSGARKGEDAGIKIKNYIISRTDSLLGDVLGSTLSFDSVAKAEYEKKAQSVNAGTFSPGDSYVGVHYLDEHL